MDYRDKIFNIADEITKFNFEEIWGIEGPTMVNQMNKEEIAEEMFFKGIAYILEHLHNLEEINIDKIQNKLKGKI